MMLVKQSNWIVSNTKTNKRTYETKISNDTDYTCIFNIFLSDIFDFILKISILLYIRLYI